eukprot:9596897-Alexandrium_andersonii.AAC.1
MRISNIVYMCAVCGFRGFATVFNTYDCWGPVVKTICCHTSPGAISASDGADGSRTAASGAVGDAGCHGAASVDVGAAGCNGAASGAGGVGAIGCNGSAS